MQMSDKDIDRRNSEGTIVGQDISECPNCVGPADNGHDGSYPPIPYFCTKCSWNNGNQNELIMGHDTKADGNYWLNKK